MYTARTRRAAAGVSVIALTSLTACGAIGDLVPGRDPFLDQSPRSMAEAAFADMQDVTSMRILGSQESKENGFTRIDLRLDETSCTGSLDAPGGSVRLLKNAEGAWFSGDDDFWHTNAGSSPRAREIVDSYAGRWAAIGKKSPLLALCDLGDMLDNFALDEDDTADTIDAGDVVQIGGADTVPVTGQEGRERFTAWVSVDSPHRVLKMAPAKDTGRPDELFFEEFGADVEAESPDKKDVVTIPGM